MPGKNIKITTKLTICTMVFLLPLGIMLFSIVSTSLREIGKDKKELEGIAVLRPAISLMQAIPQYIRISVDNMPGNREQVKKNVEDLIHDFTLEYEEVFDTKTYEISPFVLSEYWVNMLNGGTSQILHAYSKFLADLHQMIIYIGDVAGLVTDKDLESTYLVSVALHDLPQSQQRMVVINNILRSLENGTLSNEQRDDLVLHLGLLVHSDNFRVQKRYRALETLREQSAETNISEIFDALLKDSHDTIVFFVDSVQYALASPVVGTQTLIVLKETAARAYDTAIRLQEASLDRLELIAKNRIITSQRRFALYISFTVSAIIAAFAIIFVTVVGIKKSTRSVSRVFKSLEKNDLSVQIKVLSRDELGEILLALEGFLDKLNSDFALFSHNASMISTAVYDLSASTKEITTTANEQSASVAEIVSTMENNKNLSEQVAARTLDVAELATQTENLSQHGAELHDTNEKMMAEIRDQNSKITDEIKNLVDVLSRIDESVQLIDTIADRTKLIAFNAALEASSSGEAGLRFAVVAGEIRRFADNVVESAVEIKERISELQSTSNALISEADVGTQTIDLGYTRMIEQKEVFKNIVDVSQNVAARSQQISNLSKQQELASTQIFTALKEISAGVKQFVTATASTSTTADSLNNISQELRQTLAYYQTDDETNKRGKV